MDIIGITSLGVELGELASSSDAGFKELYDNLLHQGPVGQLIWVINAFLPIRRFVPLAANRKFIQSQQDLRAMLRRTIRQRAKDLEEGHSQGTLTESRDLLSYMLEEARQHQKETGKQPWTDDDIIGHVRMRTPGRKRTTYVRNMLRVMSSHSF